MNYLHSKPTKATPVTPSDTENIPLSTRGVGIYVRGTGNIVIETFDGTQLTFTGVAANTELPVKAVKVLSTGTTATNILALI